jgi:hypothetical protein
MSGFMAGIVATAVLTLAAIAPATRGLGCRQTHEWVDVGELRSRTAAGLVVVRYAGGDERALPETTVLLARVEPAIQAFEARTDDDGRFAFDGVPAGAWRLNVCQPGFKTIEGTLTIGAGGPSEVRVVTELDW